MRLRRKKGVKEMEANYRKLYRALTYIQKACDYYQDDEGCRKCPMGSDAGTCYFEVGNYPSDWRLEEPRIMR